MEVAGPLGTPLGLAQRKRRLDSLEAAQGAPRDPPKVRHPSDNSRGLPLPPVSGLLPLMHPCPSLSPFLQPGFSSYRDGIPALRLLPAESGLEQKVLEFSHKPDLQKCIVSFRW